MEMISIYGKFSSTLLFLCLWIGVNYSQQEVQILKTSDFSIGETLVFNSNILEEKRTLNIYLPHSYATNSDKSYPIIYLLDGSADEDFIHVVGLIQFLSFSWINAVPESIVVGISNIDRKRDFTFPTTNEKDKEQFPTTLIYLLIMLLSVLVYGGTTSLYLKKYHLPLKEISQFILLWEQKEI